IDHLIETDPPRASQMQKHLIALLRAAMPSLREASDGGARDLGRELDMVKPYIEILKVRMEERLDSQILVPEGLLSAEFPPMMIQTLVENAIRHGLEPKPEGGRLSVSAEVAHGQLVVRIIDTGIGLAETETSTTTSTATAAGNSAPARSAGGLGLANIRERLALLYGRQARLELVPLRAPDGTVSGTMATITLPYRPLATPDV
ncbi:MAG: hypothetical protein RL722_764, partial [Pseudomonadota bacterium]